MGCDIHSVIQVKKRDDWDSPYAWAEVAIPDEERCYTLFWFLTGVVRGDWDEPNLGPPRGVPKDFDIYTRERFLSGEHTQHWFDLNDARKVDGEWLKTAYEYSDWPWQQWQKWLRTMEFCGELYDVTPDRVRGVMDFDS